MEYVHLCFEHGFILFQDKIKLNKKVIFDSDSDEGKEELITEANVIASSSSSSSEDEESEQQHEVFVTKEVTCSSRLGVVISILLVFRLID